MYWLKSSKTLQSDGFDGQFRQLAKFGERSDNRSIFYHYLWLQAGRCSQISQLSKISCWFSLNFDLQAEVWGCRYGMCLPKDFKKHLLWNWGEHWSISKSLKSACQWYTKKLLSMKKFQSNLGKNLLKHLVAEISIQSERKKSSRFVAFRFVLIKLCLPQTF